MDLASNGSSITKKYVNNYDLKYTILKIIKDEPAKEVKEVKEKQISLEDFTKDFKI